MTMTMQPRPGLTRARERAGLSQGAAAQLAGVHRVQLNRYEKGEVAPSVDIALKISRALGVSVEQAWAPESSAPGTRAGRTRPEETIRGTAAEGS